MAAGQRLDAIAELNRAYEQYEVLFGRAAGNMCWY
jgi:hypothetical protein